MKKISVVLWMIASSCFGQEVSVQTNIATRYGKAMEQLSELPANSNVLSVTSGYLALRRSNIEGIVDSNRRTPMKPEVDLGQSVTPASATAWNNSNVFHSQSKFPPRIRNDSIVVDSSEVKKLTTSTGVDILKVKFCETKTQDVISPCEKGAQEFGQNYLAHLVPDFDACRKQQKEIADKLDSLSEGLGDKPDQDQISLVSAYYAACTTANIPARMAMLLGVFIDISVEVPSGTGVVVGGRTYQPVGMGVQISDTKVYTARHVLVHEERSDKKMRKMADLIYVPFISPTIQLRFAGEPDTTSEDEFDPNNIGADQAVLNFSTPFPLKTPYPKITAAFDGTSATPLIVAGLALPLAQVERKIGLNAASWPNYLRRDASPTCMRVTQNAKGCLMHTCDTAGGLSGSPLFIDDTANPAAAPTIIGIHHGGASADQRQSCNATGATMTNIAAVPNLKFLSH